MILEILYFYLPLGTANSAPVLTKNILKRLAIPLDMNKTFRGRRLFGNHKTLRGFLAAIIFGTIIFYVQKLLYTYPLFESLSLIDYSQYSLFLGFLMSLGAITGDLVKSFFKRRMNIKPGQSWIPFDQIDYIIGSLLFMSLIYVPSIMTIIGLFLIGGSLSMFAHYMGYIIGLNEEKF